MDTILLITEDRALIDQVGEVLRKSDHKLVILPAPADVMESLDAHPDGVVLLLGPDTLAVKQTATLMREIQRYSPLTQQLVLAAQAELQQAVKALNHGACQYALLPAADEELMLLVEMACKQRRQQARRHPVRRTRKREKQFGSLVGRSRPMQELYEQIRLAAETDIPVLLYGETGTGKDLVAQAIHQESQRQEHSFVPVHLGALPTELVASELFGAERGAFTGATAPRSGKLEEADEGTIFLDEIGTIDDKVQITLLRVIEQHRFTRLGGRQARDVNVRLIAATNTDLAAAVESGDFREDLYFRLNVFRIALPPLRERFGDLPLLVNAFIERFNSFFSKNVTGIAPECFAILEAHSWPGNVRELKNVMQHAILMADDSVLAPRHLPDSLAQGSHEEDRVSFRVGTSLAQVEREMIIKTLEAAGNNRTRTAKLLGISRRSLYSKLDKHRIG